MDAADKANVNFTIPSGSTNNRECIGVQADASGATTTLGNNPISTTLNSSTVTVAAPSHGRAAGSNVYLSGVAEVAGLVIRGGYKIQSAATNSFTITVRGKATSTATGGGSAVRLSGATVRSYWIAPGANFNAIFLSESVNLAGQSSWASTGTGTIECAIAPDPYQPKRLLFVRNNDMVVRELKEVGGTVQTNALLDLRPFWNAEMLAHGVNINAAGFRMRTPQIEYVIPDPNMEGLWYFMVGSAVGMMSAFRSIPGSASFAVEDITHDMPLCDGWLHLCDLTGDVFVTGSMGGWCFPPPTIDQGYPALSGRRGRHWNRLKTYYERADVSDVPLG